MSGDRWVIGSGTATGTDYVIHLDPPRFIVAFDDDGESGDVEMIDQIPAKDAARLMREAGEVIAAEIGEDDAE
jgi:hypothetical protein